MRTTNRPIVGREHELALLHEPGPARLIEIVGDPGIGKTSLLGELARAGAFTGRATEFEQHVPFGVFLDALADRVARLDAGERDRIGEQSMELLTAVFHGADTTQADLHGVGRHRLYRAVRTLLEVVSPVEGGTLLLDDMHWADEGSVGLLEFLVRHPPTGRFRLGVGYRPRQASERLFAALSHASGSERLRLELKPLTLQQVCQLLPDVDAARARQLHDSSGGNPFYLDALTRVAADGDPEVALSAEFAALTPRVLLVAQAAALAGDPFDPELVAEVAELPEAETLADLDELVARDLIRAENSARRFRYRHPLVRSAAYRTGRAAWRLDAHARAAAGLERRGAPATSRAHHVERAARAGDDKAVAVLVEAAESVLASVPALAIDWLRTAIDLLPRTPELRSRLCGLMLLQARAMLVIGQLHECRGTLQEVLALLPAEPSEQRSTAVSMCATVERLLGRYDEAQALLVGELARLPDRHDRPALGMRIDIAAGLLQCAKFEDARGWVTEALDSPARHRMRPLTTTIGLSILATADAYTGRFDSAVGHVRRAAAMLDGLSDGELGERLYLTLEVAWSELVLERFYDALRHVRRCAALAERGGHSHLQPDILLTFTHVYGQLGDLTQAAEHAETTLETALLMDRTELLEVIHARQSEIALWRGDLKAALQYAEQAVEKTQPGAYWWSGEGTAALAAARLANGDPQGCLQELLRGGDPTLVGYAPSLRRLWFDELVRAEIALGHIESALDWGRRAEESVAGGDLPGRTAQAWLASARAQLAGKDPTAAAELAGKAADNFAQVHLPVFEGQARHLAGAALADLGRREEAQQQLGRAKELFANCGAAGMHAAVVQQQRLLGARSTRVRKDGGPLTQRELEIAELVATGYTNRQIATQLFMSPKTVEAHLSRIFTKLGVASRTAVASHLARHASGM
ncbi:helix-turn-helix transcriptional regulator [Kutzneria kofuensis]|uniref:ATP/maltotriose-dependent transcriptional regulator MalT n=1 Tax=Kutzneria kofuensis TaxID=103725 RepID=A0A7W9KRW4_9PSEU|nr:helix-turn-helix transcriptional regulator [Kutzneria kofuensis]MBB5897492.1 ATP/maltotriose-dependent transcriptional regulator MalT [Kutzneria kofuensis]